MYAQAKASILSEPDTPDPRQPSSMMDVCSFVDSTPSPVIMGGKRRKTDDKDVKNTDPGVETIKTKPSSKGARKARKTKPAEAFESETPCDAADDAHVDPQPNLLESETYKAAKSAGIPADGLPVEIPKGKSNYTIHSPINGASWVIVSVIGYQGLTGISLCRV